MLFREKSLDALTRKELIELVQDKETLQQKFQATNQALEEKITYLEEELSKLRDLLFGRTSEKLKPEEIVFDEPTLADDSDEIETADETITVAAYERNPSNKGRKPLPKHFKRIERVYDLAENEKQCGCGSELSHIGDVRSEQLEIIPAQFYVIVHVRKKYACRVCEENIKEAKLPATPIPKSIAAPGLLAHIIVAKYKDHLPLYRQENILQRLGVDIARRTLSSWIIKCADLLEPLVKLIHDGIINYDVGYADETPVKVLSEPGRQAHQKSYMWLFGGGAPHQFGWVYQYSASRSHQIPLDFLADFNGYLHSDGYQGYETLAKARQTSQDKPIINVGCWAHCRRKFIEAKKVSKRQGLASQYLSYIQKLARLEAKAAQAGLTTEQVWSMRQKEAQPLLDKMRSWLDEYKTKVPKESTLGKAISYTQNQWDKLIHYCSDGRLEMTNNRSERKIKPFVTGRKNWLFSQSVAGAKASAILYSLVQTCAEHDVAIYPYFAAVLSAIPRCQRVEELEALLPYNIDKKSLDAYLPEQLKSPKPG